MPQPLKIKDTSVKRQLLGIPVIFNRSKIQAHTKLVVKADKELEKVANKLLAKRAAESAKKNDGEPEKKKQKTEK